MVRVAQPAPDVAENEVVYEIVSGPNREGKLLFHRFWRTLYNPNYAELPPCGYHIKAQCFLADLNSYVVQDKAEGKTVRIIDRR